MLCKGQNKAWAGRHESPLSQKDTNHLELLFLNIYIDMKQLLQIWIKSVQAAVPSQVLCRAVMARSTW